MPRPDLSKVPYFYHGYIERITGEEINVILQEQGNLSQQLLKNITENNWDFRYGPEKWSIKEVVQHIIDAERIFSYRALCFARKDQTALPGFDENSYAYNSGAASRTADSLRSELATVQGSTKMLFRSFGEEQLASEGTANGKAISVNAIGYIIAGHCLHHMHILEERYLPLLREESKI